MHPRHSPSLGVVDATGFVVVAATIALYVVDQRFGGADGVRIILTIAVLKCSLIAAVFMGLASSARIAFAALGASFVGLGLVLGAVLT